MNPLERLRRAGVGFANDPGFEDVRTECTRLAGSLLDRGYKLIGLVPVDASVAIPPLAIQLGRSLVGLCGAAIGIIDATATWPTFETTHTSGHVQSLFSATWIDDSLAILSPRTFDAGAMLRNIGMALEAEAAIFAVLIVDMTGFDQMGEHLAAIALMDGLIPVARAGSSRDDRIARWLRDIPADRNLGILLTGA